MQVKNMGLHIIRNYLFHRDIELVDNALQSGLVFHNSWVVSIGQIICSIPLLEDKSLSTDTNFVITQSHWSHNMQC